MLLIYPNICKIYILFNLVFIALSESQETDKSSTTIQNDTDKIEPKTSPHCKKCDNPTDEDETSWCNENCPNLFKPRSIVVNNVEDIYEFCEPCLNEIISMVFSRCEAKCGYEMLYKLQRLLTIFAGNPDFFETSKETIRETQLVPVNPSVESIIELMKQLGVFNVPQEDHCGTIILINELPPSPPIIVQPAVEPSVQRVIETIIPQPIIIPIPEPFVDVPKTVIQNPQPIIPIEEPFFELSEAVIQYPQPIFEYPQPIFEYPQPILEYPQPIIPIPDPFFELSKPVVQNPQPIIPIPEPIPIIPPPIPMPYPQPFQYQPNYFEQYVYEPINAPYYVREDVTNLQPFGSIALSIPDDEEEEDKTELKERPGNSSDSKALKDSPENDSNALKDSPENNKPDFRILGKNEKAKHLDEDGKVDNVKSQKHKKQLCKQCMERQQAGTSKTRDCDTVCYLAIFSA